MTETGLAQTRPMWKKAEQEKIEGRPSESPSKRGDGGVRPAMGGDPAAAGSVGWQRRWAIGGRLWWVFVYLFIDWRRKQGWGPLDPGYLFDCSNLRQSSRVAYLHNYL